MLESGFTQESAAAQQQPPKAQSPMIAQAPVLNETRRIWRELPRHAVTTEGAKPQALQAPRVESLRYQGQWERHPDGCTLPL